MNRAILIGRVGKDPDIRNLNNGDRVASFSLATSERWKDKTTGDRKETTTWHNIVCFNQGLIKVIEEYVLKGGQIAIEGKIQNRKYEKDGIERYVTEIVLGKFDGSLELLGGKGEGGGRDRDEHGYGTTRDRGYASDRAGRDDVDRGFGGGGGGDFDADLDSEIPFISMFSLR
jgi:single-strand DNA-binding protein